MTEPPLPPQPQPITPHPVTVLLPADGVTDQVDARPTNGEIDSGSVPIDPSSRRAITAATTNGTVTDEAR